MAGIMDGYHVYNRKISKIKAGKPSKLYIHERKSLHQRRPSEKLIDIIETFESKPTYILPPERFRRRCRTDKTRRPKSMPRSKSDSSKQRHNPNIENDRMAPKQKTHRYSEPLPASSMPNFKPTKRCSVYNSDEMQMYTQKDNLRQVASYGVRPKRSDVEAWNNDGYRSEDKMPLDSDSGSCSESSARYRSTAAQQSEMEVVCGKINSSTSNVRNGKKAKAMLSDQLAETQRQKALGKFMMRRSPENISKENIQRKISTLQVASQEKKPRVSDQRFTELQSRAKSCNEYAKQKISEFLQRRQNDTKAQNHQSKVLAATICCSQRGKLITSRANPNGNNPTSLEKGEHCRSVSDRGTPTKHMPTRDASNGQRQRSRSTCFVVLSEKPIHGEVGGYGKEGVTAAIDDLPQGRVVWSSGEKFVSTLNLLLTSNGPIVESKSSSSTEGPCTASKSTSVSSLRVAEEKGVQTSFIYEESYDSLKTTNFSNDTPEFDAINCGIEVKSINDIYENPMQTYTVGERWEREENDECETTDDDDDEDEEDEKEEGEMKEEECLSHIGEINSRNDYSSKLDQTYTVNAYDAGEDSEGLYSELLYNDVIEANSSRRCPSSIEEESEAAHERSWSFSLYQPATAVTCQQHDRFASGSATEQEPSHHSHSDSMLFQPATSPSSCCQSSKTERLDAITKTKELKNEETKRTASKVHLLKESRSDSLMLMSKWKPFSLNGLYPPCLLEKVPCFQGQFLLGFEDARKKVNCAHRCWHCGHTHQCWTKKENQTQDDVHVSSQQVENMQQTSHDIVSTPAVEANKVRDRQEYSNIGGDISAVQNMDISKIDEVADKYMPVFQSTPCRATSEEEMPRGDIEDDDSKLNETRKTSPSVSGVEMDDSVLEENAENPSASRSCSSVRSGSESELHSEDPVMEHLESLMDVTRIISHGDENPTHENNNVQSNHIDNPDNSNNNSSKIKRKARFV